MHSTRNDLPGDIRKKACELLQARLADVLDLAMAIKQAHWTIRGPGFLQLHELFDELAGEAAGYADDLAERIAQLGGQPRGTAQAAAKESSLKPYPVELSAQDGHLDAVADRLAAFGKGVRKNIDQADRLGDADTTDLFTEISRGVDKGLWKVEAHRPSKG